MAMFQEIWAAARKQYQHLLTRNFLLLPTIPINMRSCLARILVQLLFPPRSRSSPRASARWVCSVGAGSGKIMQSSERWEGNHEGDIEFDIRIGHDLFWMRRR